MGVVGVFATVMTLSGTASTIQQRRGEPRKSDAEVVLVVGCLESRAGGTWVITNATEPVSSKSPATTTAALEEAAAEPLGTRTFQLVGVRFFDPEKHSGHKVAVKGVLVKGASESRVNITSLQTVRPSCQS